MKMTNKRFLVLETFSIIPKGSVVEINVQPKTAMRVPYATVHIYGSELKLYLVKEFIDDEQLKLEPINADD